MECQHQLQRANDFGFETYFERQVKAHGKKMIFYFDFTGGEIYKMELNGLIKAADQAKNLICFNIFGW